MTQHFHLEALAGHVGMETLSISPGHAITLGSESDCLVTGEGVLATHGCLAFFEGELWALSSSVAAPIYVGALPAIMWTVVQPGTILTIGTARLQVTAADAPAEEVDLSELGRRSVRLRIPRYSHWMSA